MQNKSFGTNIIRGIRIRLQKIFHNPYQAVNMGSFKKTYYKHLNPGKIRTHRLHGRALSFTSPTELLHGLKEIFVDEIYKQELQANAYIIDCGANIGLSVIYLKENHPDAEILAFEPDEQNFQLLETNVRSFDLKNVQLRKEAVWVEDKILNFSGKGSTESKLIDQNENGSVKVQAIKLKNLLHRQIDLLKIDIEGAEYQVLKDIDGQLHCVNHLFLEYHGTFDQNSELNEILEILVRNDFRYYLREAASVFNTPFLRPVKNSYPFDIQLNIFCFRN